MCKVNVLEAKTNFSKLLALLESKEEDEIKNCHSVKKKTVIPTLKNNCHFRTLMRESIPYNTSKQKKILRSTNFQGFVKNQ